MSSVALSGKHNKQGIMAMTGCIIIMAMNVTYQVVMVSFPFIYADLGIDKIQASIMPTVLTAATLLMALVGTKLIDWLTPKYSMLIGTLLVVAFLVGNAFVTDYVVFLLLAVLAGAGSALGTLASAAGIMRQFWGVKAGSMFSLVAGIQTLLVASYTTLLGILWNFMDYKSAFLIIAVIALVLGVGANLILIKKPDEELIRSNEEELAAEKREKVQSHEKTDGWTLAESFKHSTMYLFMVGMIAAAVISGGFTTFCTTFLVENGVDASASTFYLSYFTIICGVHMAYSGFFQKKFGNRWFFVFFYSGVVLGFLLLAFWTNLSAGASVAVLIISLTLIGCIKPVMTTAAIVTPNLFGNKDYVAYNSFSQALFNGGKMISSFTTATILQFLGSLAMCYFFAVLGAIAGIALVISDIVSPWAKKGKNRSSVNSEDYLESEE